MAASVKFIVEKLKGEPFNMTGLSLVVFDEKVGMELVQLLNDVFAKLDDQNKVDLRDEEPEATATRLFNFLRIVKFNVPQGANVYVLLVRLEPRSPHAQV